MATKSKIKVSVLLDKLCDLGWEYTCGTMTRSGMQTYDEIMQVCSLYTRLGLHILPLFVQ